MRSRNTRVVRIVFNGFALGMSAAFLAAFVHHAYSFDFRALAGLGVPILLVFFGFASLFFIRGRSMAKGSAQFRSLVAAERAVQAALWHLGGIMLTTVLYALLRRSGVTPGTSAPWLVLIWVLLFLVPHALSQIALFSFIRAVLVVAPHLFRRVGAFELRRRVALT
jgi:hypothetical protein